MFELILGFFTNLFAVFVGVYFALYMDRREKQRIENEERIKISRSLKIELENNLERIARASGEKITIPELKQRRRNILLTRFNTAVLESVINSGKLTLLKSQIQYDLSNIHQILKLSEMTTNRIRDFMTSVD